MHGKSKNTSSGPNATKPLKKQFKKLNSFFLKKTPKKIKKNGKTSQKKNKKKRHRRGQRRQNGLGGFTTVDKKPVELRTFTVSFYDMDRRVGIECFWGWESLLLLVVLYSFLRFFEGWVFCYWCFLVFWKDESFVIGFWRVIDCFWWFFNRVLLSSLVDREPLYRDFVVIQL